MRQTSTSYSDNFNLTLIVEVLFGYTVWYMFPLLETAVRTATHYLPGATGKPLPVNSSEVDRPLAKDNIAEPTTPQPSLQELLEKAKASFQTTAELKSRFHSQIKESLQKEVLEFEHRRRFQSHSQAQINQALKDKFSKFERGTTSWKADAREKLLQLLVKHFPPEVKSYGGLMHFEVVSAHDRTLEKIFSKSESNLKKNMHKLDNLIYQTLLIGRQFKDEKLDFVPPTVPETIAKFNDSLKDKNCVRNPLPTTQKRDLTHSLRVNLDLDNELKAYRTGMPSLTKLLPQLIYMFHYRNRIASAMEAVKALKQEVLNARPGIVSYDKPSP
jgi:hypothetical protein